MINIYDISDRNTTSFFWVCWDAFFCWIHFEIFYFLFQCFVFCTFFVTAHKSRVAEIFHFIAHFFVYSLFCDLCDTAGNWLFPFPKSGEIVLTHCTVPLYFFCYFVTVHNCRVADTFHFIAHFCVLPCVLVCGCVCVRVH